MTSEEKIESNRRNAENSTGPSTVSGKQRSCCNALKLGLHAKSLLLPKENRREYQRCRTEFFEMYAPIGPAEETLAQLIVGYAWRLLRIDLAEAENLKQLSKRLEKPMRLSQESKANDDPGRTLLEAFVPPNSGPPMEEISRQRRLVTRDFLANIEALLAMQARRKSIEGDKN